MAILGVGLNNFTNPSLNDGSLTLTISGGNTITSVGTTVTSNDAFDFLGTVNGVPAVKVGDTIVDGNGAYGVVASITDHTTLELEAPMSSGDVTGTVLKTVVRPIVVSPYPDTFTRLNRPSQEWIDQGIKAFVIQRSFETGHFENTSSIRVDFIPSDNTANYTVTLWVLSAFGDWVPCANQGTNSYTGRKQDTIELNGLHGRTLYFSIDSINSGTLSIAVDEGGNLVEAI